MVPGGQAHPVAARGVLVRGQGVGALAAQRALEGNRVPLMVDRGVDRGAAPVVMLGEQATGLLSDLFGAGLFASGHPITRRIVRWGSGDAVTLPHRALAVTGAALLGDLQARCPAGPAVVPTPAPSFTLHAGDGLPTAALQAFGQREAAAVPVTLAGGADAAAVLVESTPGGWLFLIPLGPRQGWLLAVGGEPDALLADSRLVAPALAHVAAVEARFRTAPRLLDPPCGAGWLAVGSAALAFDPLCGDGTATAARGGLLAAAVASAIADPAPDPFGHDEPLDPAALVRHYRAMLIAALRRHLAACLPFYQHGGSSAWWREQAEATAQGHQWCTQMLAVEPEPAFALHGTRLVARVPA